MLRNENKIFKTFVDCMYSYYFPDSINTYDGMMESIKSHKVQKDDKETNADVDYYTIYELVRQSIEEKWLDIKEDFLRDLMIDFWLDLSPTYEK